MAKKWGVQPEFWWFLPCFQRSLGEVVFHLTPVITQGQSDPTVARCERVYEARGGKHFGEAQRDESFPTWKRNERWSLEEKFFIGSYIIWQFLGSMWKKMSINFRGVEVKNLPGHQPFPINLELRTSVRRKQQHFDGLANRFDTYFC